MVRHTIPGVTAPWRTVLAGILALAFSLPNPAAAPPASAAGPEGQLTWAVHVSLAPAWFDPADTPSLITPFMILPALHDALIKPMPGKPMAPSLAQSWSQSKDGTTYEFVLRKGVKFHNGDPLTAEDVKFSFERYRGSAAKLFKDNVIDIEVVDPHRIRFRLKQPWPDFMTFFGTPAAGIAWIVPKKYLQQVGDEGFKRAPVGAGPYKFVSFKPGVELVLEAFEEYWRKAPSVKRLVLRVVPDESTRLAMLKRGEADISYSLRAALAEEVRRTPGLKLAAVVIPASFWIDFVEQWDSKSPWHDRRVRLAANLAIDRNAINQAETLGFSKVHANFIPHTFEYYWSAPPYPHDPARARKLLAEAGYPNGFDAGEYNCDSSYANLGEAVVNDLQAVGIRVRLRPAERAAFFQQYREKKLKNLVQASSGAFGNAATRIEAYATRGGLYTYGTHPEIDGLFSEQLRETNPRARKAILEKIQQIVHERVMYAPIWDLGFLSGVGPRVAESGMGLISGHPYSAPYEDLKLKKP